MLYVNTRNDKAIHSCSINIDNQQMLFTVIYFLFIYEQNLTDPTYTGIDDIRDQSPQSSNKSELGFRILSSVLKGGQRVQLDLNGVPASEVQAHLVGASGVVIATQQVSPDATVQLPPSLPRGLYVLSLSYKGTVQAFKVYAE